MTEHDDDSLYELVQDIAYWGTVAAAAFLTLAAAVGIASYLWHRWL